MATHQQDYDFGIVRRRVHLAKSLQLQPDTEAQGLEEITSAPGTSIVTPNHSQSRNASTFWRLPLEIRTSIYKLLLARYAAAFDPLCQCFSLSVSQPFWWCGCAMTSTAQRVMNNDYIFDPKIDQTKATATTLTHDTHQLFGINRQIRYEAKAVLFSLLTVVIREGASPFLVLDLLEINNFMNSLYVYYPRSRLLVSKITGIFEDPLLRLPSLSGRIRTLTWAISPSGLTPAHNLVHGEEFAQALGHLCCGIRSLELSCRAPTHPLLEPIRYPLEQTVFNSRHTLVGEIARQIMGLSKMNVIHDLSGFEDGSIVLKIGVE